MKQILTIRNYFLERFGFHIYRVPIDPGFPCPHREKDGSGGCIFCGPEGGRARHLKPGMSLEEQVRTGIEKIQTRYHSSGPYASYFQAFTPTNAELGALRACYEKVLSLAEFKVIFIASRPDTLPDEVLDYLEELNSRYEVWVELGVQTANDETLKRINRGHDFAAVRDAVKRLHERGIRTAAHVILGLPGETPEDYMHTARELAVLPFDGIKVHHLQVLRDTHLELLLDRHEVIPLSACEYARYLTDFLRILPEKWVVMRLCADAAPENVIAPHWWLDKAAFTDLFLRMYQSEGPVPETMKTITTNDGSSTIYHPQYKQYFHPLTGAWTVSQKLYIEPCRIRELLESGKNASILDIGFGLGYHVSAAVELAESMTNHTRLYITTLEKDRTALRLAAALPDHRRHDLVQAIAETGHYESENANVDLMYGDARDSVRFLNARFDFIFLDAFSPEKNPELWTRDFIEHLKPLLKTTGFLVSSCTEYPFLNALLKSGFYLYETKGFDRQPGGIAAVLEPFSYLPPLDRKDSLIAQKTTSGIPYRDPFLRWTRNEILENHRKQITEAKAQGMPKHYRKISS